MAAAAATSAALWIPKPVTGYTAAETRGLAAGQGVRPGISKWDLETPALCVDLDVMERNVARMQAALKKNGTFSRPHAKTHKSAAIAKYQLATGSIGICCAKISEAEALHKEGVRPILMTTSNPSPSKIKRAMAIATADRTFIQAVDEERNARDLDDAARQAGIVADVVIDVAVGTRSGVPAGEQAIALARVIEKLPHLTLRGMLSYDGGVQHAKGFAARKERALRTIEANAATHAELRKLGVNTGIFSGGGTGTYNIMHLVPGFSDIQVGSYVFMDMQYLAIGSEDGNETFADFDPALTVTATILNDRFPPQLTTDAGTKALTLNKPNAAVVGEPGMEHIAGSDEFGTVRVTAATKTYRIGDKLELIAPHCDPVVNLYGQMYGIRKGLVETVWPVTARGLSQ